MKLHIHRANIGDTIWQAYTRDKAGKALTKNITVATHDNQCAFKRSDWKYIEPISIDFSSPREDIKLLRSEIKEKGVSIAEVRKFPHDVYVYDLQFDNLDARIYSLDEDLSRFKSRQAEIELSPLGEFLGYDEIKFVDKISNRYYFELQRMEIDLDNLVENGFCFAVVLEVDDLERKRRFLQRQLRRKLPEKVKDMGIVVDDVTIHSLRYEEKTKENAETPSEIITKEPPRDMITIENNPIINVNTNSIAKNESKNSKKYLIAIIGFIASTLSIMAYFEFNVHDLKNLIMNTLKSLIIE